MAAPVFTHVPLRLSSDCSPTQLRTFFTEFRTSTRANRWTAAAAARQLPGFLPLGAQALLEAAPAVTQQSVDLAETYLHEQLFPGDVDRVLQRELWGIVMSPNELALDFYGRITHLGRKAYHNLTAAQLELDILLPLFVSHLPNRYRAKVELKDPPDLPTALRLARQYETQAPTQAMASNNQRGKFHPSGPRKPDTGPSKYCQFHRSKSHNTEDCRDRPSSYDPGPRTQRGRGRSQHSRPTGQSRPVSAVDVDQHESENCDQPSGSGDGWCDPYQGSTPDQ